MTNSVIINGTLKLIDFFKNAYRHSGFNKLFIKVDEALSKYTLNSCFAQIFIKESKRDFLKSSQFYTAANKMLSTSRKIADLLKDWIIGSSVANLGKDVVLASQKSPLRMIGVFGTALLVSNIAYSAIMGRGSIALMAVKLVLLFVFVLMSRVKIDFIEMLNTSKVFGIFKWFISCED